MGTVIKKIIVLAFAFCVLPASSFALDYVLPSNLFLMKNIPAKTGPAILVLDTTGKCAVAVYSLLSEEVVSNTGVITSQEYWGRTAVLPQTECKEGDDYNFPDRLDDENTAS